MLLPFKHINRKHARAETCQRPANLSLPEGALRMSCAWEGLCEMASDGLFKHVLGNQLALPLAIIVMGRRSGVQAGSCVFSLSHHMHYCCMRHACGLGRWVPA